MKGTLRTHSRLIGSVNLVAVLVFFFAVPINPSDSSVRLAVDLVFSVVSLVAMSWIVVREVRAELRGDSAVLRGLRLLVLFEIVLVVFALTYYALSVYSDHEMAGLHTRLDALYFTATTMATVGYGDIHPVGQLARGVATVHIAFDVVFVAVFARLITAHLGHRREVATRAARGDSTED